MALHLEIDHCFERALQPQRVDELTHKLRARKLRLKLQYQRFDRVAVKVHENAFGQEQHRAATAV
ncbi:MAG: hypothetical protein AMJ75_11215 [Phycisphaerae bacterium SM1_79]|nr:MAG: hypothetical protein AMJ75_11215 [Phycisphaerae bacterium SM1_79]